MTDPTPQTEEAREAEIMGEKPDLGRTPDAMTEALSGSGGGSDTRAGSLRGGSASGSELDPDQAAINAGLARQGQTAGPAPAPSPPDPNPVNNTGEDSASDLTGPAGDPAEGKRPDGTAGASNGAAGGDDADAATG